jgi:hypothetical protein
MPRKKRIDQYEHKGKTRVNNPEVGLQTIWIVDKGRDVARLVTAYPRKV